MWKKSLVALTLCNHQGNVELFSYLVSCTQYLSCIAIPDRETDQDMDDILSRDWMIKFAAAWVPRGMEMNESFIRALNCELKKSIVSNCIKEIGKDEQIISDSLMINLKARVLELEGERMLSNSKKYWTEFLHDLKLEKETKEALEDSHVFIAKRLEMICHQVIEYAKKAYLYNERISSEMFNQPKSVDTVYEDFAPEAQGFANSLGMSAAFSAGALSFNLIESVTGGIFGAILAALNIFISFGTVANSSRYRVRNEEARVIFYDEKFGSVLRGVFSAIEPK